MAVIWASDLDTGIAEIDEQHKKLLNYINQLAECFDRDSVGRVLADLTDYTVLHFAFEQHLLEKLDYRHASSHKYEHANFIEQLMKFVARHDKGEDIIDDLYILQSTWLINHIKRDHVAYIPASKTNIIVNVIERVRYDESAWMDKYYNRLLVK